MNIMKLPQKQLSCSLKLYYNQHQHIKTEGIREALLKVLAICDLNFKVNVYSFRRSNSFIFFVYFVNHYQLLTLVHSERPNFVCNFGLSGSNWIKGRNEIASFLSF